MTLCIVRTMLLSVFVVAIYNFLILLLIKTATTLTATCQGENVSAGRFLSQITITSIYAANRGSAVSDPACKNLTGNYW